MAAWIAERACAIVGTRAATSYGEYVAGDFAAGLVERDVAAKGLDSGPKPEAAEEQEAA